jgi:hypothetical protein
MHGTGGWRALSSTETDIDADTDYSAEDTGTNNNSCDSPGGDLGSCAWLSCNGRGRSAAARKGRRGGGGYRGVQLCVIKIGSIILSLIATAASIENDLRDDGIIQIYLAGHI